MTAGATSIIPIIVHDAKENITGLTIGFLYVPAVFMNGAARPKRSHKLRLVPLFGTQVLDERNPNSHLGLPALLVVCRARAMD